MHLAHAAEGVAAVGAVLALSACTAAVPIGPSHQPPSVGRSPFTGEASAGQWREPVPDDAAIDEDSAAYVTLLNTLEPVLSIRQSAVPVYVAGPETPRHTVAPTAAYAGAVNTLADVPIPEQAAEGVESDDHVVVIDRGDGCLFDFYQPRPTATGWTAAWVNATPLEGDGLYPDGLGTRAGAVGLVWPEELRDGRIDHPLVFAYPFTRPDVVVGVATGTDGSSTEADALPIGAHLVLDRTIDIDRLGLAPAERTIARALQEYGMVLIDTSAGFTLYAPHPKGFSADPYTSILGDEPYASLASIPFDRMQVLELGRPRERYLGPPIQNRCTEARRR
jgi:hypothetical protein